MKAYFHDETDTDIWSLLGKANLMTGNISEAEFILAK